MSIQEHVTRASDPAAHRSESAETVTGRTPAELSAYHRAMASLRGRRNTVATWWLAAMALVGGVVMALTVESIFPIVLSTSGVLDAISVVSAAAGTLGILFLVVLASRVPALEKAVGQDGLIAWHKVLGPVSLWLIAVHITATVLSTAFAATGNAVSATISFLFSDGDLILALLGALVFLLGGVTSWSKVRGRLPRSLWWSIHLSLYAGIILAFFHQITAGGPFVSGLSKVLWIGVYVGVAAVVVVYRVLRPLMASNRHAIRVEAVVNESPGVVSIWMRGHKLEELGVEPGQFMSFRFFTAGLAWHAHPFSVSAVPGNGLVRITVAEAGRATQRMRYLRAGTRVSVEGPYGVLTPMHFGGERAVLVGGGVGIAPLIPLAREFAQQGVRTDVVYRVSTSQRAPLLQELEDLDRDGWIRLHVLAGPRLTQPLHAARLRSLLGDVSQAEIYLCGPTGMTNEVRVAARALGTAPDRIHSELFQM
ncbi:ferredoxin reductase family protein [Kocuria sp.]|uniref:ferredoxin reductase family protein n=1 Tax=Kocuria sp. TaxID=1871328 RepID=UPI0026DEEB02|nr:ferredoxin reductase family protein [Kocuria sp.]MDO5619435.1 ferredoxin reductase family protein [Kocuria sp.]